jgi:hypothetical protein
MTTAQQIEAGIILFGYLAGIFTGWQFKGLWLKMSHNYKKSVDTQKNTYGRLKNALEPLSKPEDQERGVVVHPLGNFVGPKHIYTINIFWGNKKSQLGILGVQVYPNYIGVETHGGYPRGETRDYTTENLSDSEIQKVIDDVRLFVEETNKAAEEIARRGRY